MKQMKRKPVVGEALYRLNIGNAARRCDQKLTPVKVTSVGRKYFKCAPVDPILSWDESEFFIEGWFQNNNGYPSDYQIYETEQDWEDEKEFGSLFCEIKTAFDIWSNVSLTLKQLRDIQAIISTPTP